MLVFMLGVMLPAAALIVAGVLHLRTIQREEAIEAVFQREYQQVLAIAEKRIDARAYEIAEEPMANFPRADQGDELEVSSKEFELLKYFICHSGETLSRDRLLEDVWGYENSPTTRTVDTHLARLRQKLEPDPEQPQYFLTVHGTGYRFVG